VKDGRCVVFLGLLLAVGACSPNVSHTPSAIVSQDGASLHAPDLSPDAGIFKEYGVPTGGAGPYKMVYGPNGANSFTEFESDKIGEITSTGAFIEFDVPTADAEPDSITLGPDKNLWFAEGGGNKIARIATAGKITEFDIPTASSGPGPHNTRAIRSCT
jgi:streptogramin lyase